MLIQYRVALYTRRIFNYKKQAFKNISGIPLPRANFYFHNRTRKLVNKIIARTKYIEQGVINSGVRYHNEILKANETLSKSCNCQKTYQAHFLEKFKKDPGQIQFDQLTWREFKFNSWCVLFLPMYILIYLFIYHFNYSAFTTIQT